MRRYKQSDPRKLIHRVRRDLALKERELQRTQNRKSYLGHEYTILQTQFDEQRQTLCKLAESLADALRWKWAPTPAPAAGDPIYGQIQAQREKARFLVSQFSRQTTTIRSNSGRDVATYKAEPGTESTAHAEHEAVSTTIGHLSMHHDAQQGPQVQALGEGQVQVTRAVEKATANGSIPTVHPAIRDGISSVETEVNPTTGH